MNLLLFGHQTFSKPLTSEGVRERGGGEGWWWVMEGGGAREVEGVGGSFNEVRR